MDLAAVKEKAEKVGINTASLQKITKKELIHMIQRAEGFNSCYGSVAEGCPHVLCCFMVDCYKEAKGNQKKPAASAAKGKKK